MRAFRILGLWFGLFALLIAPAIQAAETSRPSPADSLSPAAPPAERWRPPTALSAEDQPNDNGHGIVLDWSLSADDAQLLSYEIWMARSAAAPESAWALAGFALRGSRTYSHQNEEASLKGKPNPIFVPRGTPTFFRVRGMADDGSISGWSDVASATARGNWFHKGRINVLLACLGLAGATLYFIRAARGGRKLYIRPIPGISAVDEAIGRATEMGRPILFVLGTGTAGDIATIAGYTVLSRVARKTAEYQTSLLVPVNEPVMMAMAQETVSQAYKQAGRPDLYRPESVFYISAMQFPYVAAVNGLMMREKTATNFYMGVFHAESLLLAEAGSVSGSIQISGTDQLSQIPFFVAATDYTLIGEELYAASAYLSQEPVLMGPLKAQDLIKVVIMAILVLGVIALTFSLTASDPAGIARIVSAVVHAV